MGKKYCPFLHSLINEKKVYSFSDALGASANTISAITAIYTGTSYINKGKKISK